MTAQHRADIGSPARTRQADRSGGRAATRGAEREQARASRRRRRVALGLTTGLMSVVTLSASLASTLGGGETATAVAVQDASSARSYSARAGFQQRVEPSRGAARSDALGGSTWAPPGAKSTASGSSPSRPAPSSTSSGSSATTGSTPSSGATTGSSTTSGSTAGSSTTSGSTTSGSTTSGSTTCGSTAGSSTSATRQAPATSGPAATSSATVPAAPAGGAPALLPTGTSFDGASGTGVADGSFAAWRGTPLTIAGTWADSNAGQLALWQLHPGGEYGSWNQSLDIAIGAIDNGETWAQAAQGAYDARWRQSLTNLRDAWAGRSGTLFIRFAHEMNGNWYPWSVNAGNHQDFMTAWKRFRALQQQVFPQSKLVFCLNRESVGSGIDWRKTFPGAQYVDVIGVDYYNHYPYVSSQADWDASVDDVDGTGAPKGLQSYLDFAKGVGLPVSVPEWSGVASAGDSPGFIRAIHDFFAGHAGSGPGQLLYDVQFNVDMHGNDYRLYGGTNMPQSAAAYQQAF